MSLTKDNTESNMLILPSFNSNYEYKDAYNDMLITIGIPRNNKNFRNPTNDTDGAIPSFMLSMFCHYNRNKYQRLINILNDILYDNNEMIYGHTKLFLKNSDKICNFEGKGLKDHPIRTPVSVSVPGQNAGSKYNRKHTRKTRRIHKTRSKKYKNTRRSYRQMREKKHKNKKYSRNKK